MTEIPYDELDKEIVPLVRLLNSISGIETTESCCGHDKTPCRVWCKVESFEALLALSKLFWWNEDWVISIDGYAQGESNDKDMTLIILVEARSTHLAEIVEDIEYLCRNARKENSLWNNALTAEGL